MMEEDTTMKTIIFRENCEDIDPNKRLNLTVKEWLRNINTRKNRELEHFISCFILVSGFKSRYVEEYLKYNSHTGNIQTSIQELKDKQMKLVDFLSEYCDTFDISFRLYFGCSYRIDDLMEEVDELKAENEKLRKLMTSDLIGGDSKKKAQNKKRGDNKKGGGGSSKKKRKKRKKRKNKPKGGNFPKKKVVEKSKSEKTKESSKKKKEEEEEEEEVEGEEEGAPIKNKTSEINKQEKKEEEDRKMDYRKLYEDMKIRAAFEKKRYENLKHNIDNFILKCIDSYVECDLDFNLLRDGVDAQDPDKTISSIEFSTSSGGDDSATGKDQKKEEENSKDSQKEEGVVEEEEEEEEEEDVKEAKEE